MILQVQNLVAVKDGELSKFDFLIVDHDLSISPAAIDFASMKLRPIAFDRIESQTDRATKEIAEIYNNGLISRDEARKVFKAKFKPTPTESRPKPTWLGKILSLFC